MPLEKGELVIKRTIPSSFAANGGNHRPPVTCADSHSFTRFR